MSNLRKPPDDVDTDWRCDTGRAGQGRDFYRVVHIPTGVSRRIVGLSGKDLKEITRQFVEEIREELRLKSDFDDSNQG